MAKQVTITVDEETLKGLNNAIVTFGDLCYSVFLGLPIPTKFEKLHDLSDEELKARFNAVKALYQDIEKQYDE